jgi:hypothetical protein
MALKKPIIPENLNWPPPFSKEVYSEFKFAFNNLNKFYEEYRDVLSSAQEAFKAVGTQLKEYPIIFEKLAEYGWFIGFDFEIWRPKKLYDLLLNEKIDEVNSYIIDEITIQIDNIENIMYSDDTLPVIPAYPASFKDRFLWLIYSFF